MIGVVILWGSLYFVTPACIMYITHAYNIWNKRKGAQRCLKASSVQVLRTFRKVRNYQIIFYVDIYGEYTCTIASIQNSAIYRKYDVANTGNNEPKTSTIR